MMPDDAAKVPETYKRNTFAAASASGDETRERREGA
jgi:hypothetical protein